MRKSLDLWKVVCLLALVLVAVLIAEPKMELGTRNAEDMDDLYEQVADCFVNYKSSVKFEINFDPSKFNYTELYNRVEERDSYLATNIGAISWSWRYKPDCIEFKVRLGYNASQIQMLLSDAMLFRMSRKLDGLSDYEKVKAVHDYLVLHCEYGEMGTIFSTVEQGPFWTVFSGKAVCNGYAMTFYRAMQFCGVPVTYEVGDEHAWNTVGVDGYWYNIDLTWDDAGGENVSYDYFLKCDEEFLGHEHSASNAEASIEPTGRTPQENYALVVGYDIYILLAVAAVTVLSIIVSIIAAKKTRKKLAQGRQRVSRYDGFYQD